MWKRTLRIVHFVRQLAMTALIVMISFLILEQSFRFYCFGFRSFSIPQMNSVHCLGGTNLVRASAYPEIIYELKPNLDAYHIMVPLKTNSQGLRDKEYTLDKPPHTFRVAVIGDSFTMPEGVALENAFHTLLEDRYNRESSGTLYEFINFGVAGYDPRQYLATLKHRALAYQPDFILICLCGYLDNEFLPEERFHQTFVPKAPERSFLKSFIIEFIRKKIRQQQEAKAQVNDDRLQKLDPILAELGEISRRQGIRICLVILRSYPYFPNGSDTGTKRLAARDGLFYVDTSPGFNDLNPKKYRIYPTNRHPNAKAHKIFAETIYQYLQEKRLMEHRPSIRASINAEDSFLK
ncbi:MAG TPA: SGNH/GDSL hydrolase family protein [Candidatus Bathyarchaeia archaeon]|nr:SGNH/GDSL hydrolase family protein [Candidatus Bathyarchaeia archaeon]